MIFKMLKKELKKYIPLDKSWAMRMAILDLLHGKSDRAERLLDEQELLSDDLRALKRILVEWDKEEVIDVGESGTIYRYLQFISWKEGLIKEFHTHKTLKNRKITNNPEIVFYSQSKLLTLDNGTSQWASISALCGDQERIENPPFKLALTYEAIDYWNKKNLYNQDWEFRFDQTIFEQAKSLLDFIKKGKITFIPKQAEDYCFARAFNLITKEAGEKMWPSLRGHESDRINEMEKELRNYNQERTIESQDHRVVQAIAMKGMVDKKKVQFRFPKAVNKTWPQFWDFLENVSDF